MKKIVMSAVAVTAMIGSVSNLSANDGVNILNNVKVKGQIRPRVEVASDQNAVGERAQAFTNRLHLSLTAGLLNVENLTTTIGVQSVNNFGYNRYNSTDNGVKQYDKIVDPQFAMISEASLDYTVGKTALHLGRSHVNLDNQRFIGTVGWRQNERSYDTFYVANNDVENLSVLAAWVYGFQGVKANNTADSNSILLHVGYKVSDAINIAAYDYMLASISDTYGLALTGKMAITNTKLNYRVEYAIQSDATMKIHDKDAKADASYMNLDIGANINGILLGANYELQSGSTGTDGKTAFKTPLGTNHKFNGWADKFLSTPIGGLQDMNIRAGYKTAGLGKVLAVYHIFTADKSMKASNGSSDDLGSEFDAVYVNKIPGFNNLTGLVKGAYYMGGEVDGYAKDKKVAWLQLDYKFSTK
jgi:hypothetical protein